MKKAMMILAALFVIVQIIPVTRENPPAEPGKEIILPENVKAIIENSCFDCHSNKSDWPWYSYVAPVSWLITYHVNSGRGELNFSEWNTYNEKRRDHKLKEIAEEIEEGNMPLPLYLIMHQNADLTTEQKNTLINWTTSLRNSDSLVAAENL
jgi:hypothetical protein